MRKTYDSINIIPYSTYGVVLGTSKYLQGGGLNVYFKYRIDAASCLFHHKKIRYIIVSGDNREKNYNEPKMMKKELIKKGIPSNFIYEDLYGVNTLSSVLRVYKIFHQKKFTIISQKFHNERAIFIGNCLGLEVVGFNAKNISHDSKTQLREIFARIKALWDIFSILKKYLSSLLFKIIKDISLIFLHCRIYEFLFLKEMVC
ncbi:SanA/YdcF family protein [Blattabacterium cuenoti]|uniref:SanA/YdcF family protein n=1 Tax=Blattabacterium cuenoti TaxID=1653831 RepID=UPI001EEA6AD9|nr:ElyC/SanA/YdcF family protein [Blattabacterium cuenoti]